MGSKGYNGCSNVALMNRILLTQPGYPKRDPLTGEVLPVDKHGNAVPLNKYQPPRQVELPLMGLLTTDLLGPVKESKRKVSRKTKIRSCLKKMWGFVKGGGKN